MNLTHCETLGSNKLAYTCKYKRICERCVNKNTIQNNKQQAYPFVNSIYGLMAGTIYADTDNIYCTRIWIPVTDKLPEENKTIIASTDDNVFPQARYSNKYGWEWCCDDSADYWEELNGVIAWMPLPTPYNAESEVKYERK